MPDQMVGGLAGHLVMNQVMLHAKSLLTHLMVLAKSLLICNRQALPEHREIY